jgi:hypothetical protein
MPNTKSPRTPVGKSPQPKAHRYLAAVYTDDYGRDRTLTTRNAAQFSRKKLADASRALQQQNNREMDRAIAAGDRETGRAIRRLRNQERLNDRPIRRVFVRLIKSRERIARKIRHKPPKPSNSKWPFKAQALPKYDGPIRDRAGRRGVFFRARYYSSRTSKPGVSMRVVKYIYRGAALNADGQVMMKTNVGLSIEEAVAGFDHLEQVNWSAQKGAKILNHAILAMDHRWTPEQMLEVGERWAEDRFERYGLPYCVCLHEPPPEGDQRNWHLHVAWSWRPLERLGDHEWLVSETLRTDFDGADGMRILREKFASIMTDMSIEANCYEQYTALSYAARALPVEPQVHLDEGRTRQARAGQLVEANEENHERVYRSKAALIDDELRLEEERLLRVQQAEQRIRDSMARATAFPVAPAIVPIASKLKTKLRSVSIELIRMAENIASRLDSTPRPALQAQSFRSSFTSGPKATTEFASLRIKKLASVGKAPPRTIIASAMPKRTISNLSPDLPASVLPKVAAVPSDAFVVSASFAVPTLVAVLPLVGKSDAVMAARPVAATSVRLQKPGPHTLASRAQVRHLGAPVPSIAPRYRSSELSLKSVLKAPSVKPLSDAKIPNLRPPPTAPFKAHSVGRNFTQPLPQAPAAMLARSILPSQVPAVFRYATTQFANLRKARVPALAEQFRSIIPPSLPSLIVSLDPIGYIGLRKPVAVPITFPAVPAQPVRPVSSEFAILQRIQPLAKGKMREGPNPPRSVPRSRLAGLTQLPHLAPKRPIETGVSGRIERAISKATAAMNLRTATTDMSGAQPVLARAGNGLQKSDTPVLPLEPSRSISRDWNAEAFSSGMAELPLQYRIDNFLFKMANRQFELVLREDNTVIPKLVNTESYGITNDILASKRCQRPLMNQYVHQEVELDALEFELWMHVRDGGDLFDADLIKKARLSERAQQTADAFSRTAAFRKIIDRIQEKEASEDVIPNRVELLMQKSIDASTWPKWQKPTAPTLPSAQYQIGRTIEPDL